MKIKRSGILFIVLLIASIGNCIRQERVPGKEVSVLFAGDVMLDWGIQDIIEKKDYRYPLEELKSFLNRFDYRFCNLENPVSDIGEPHPDKMFLFLARPEHLELLKYGGFNGVSLGNNHTCDYGSTGLLNTMSNLRKAGIDFSGAGENSGTAYLPLSIIINGIKVAVLSYSAIGYKGFFADKGNPGIARARLNSIRQNINQFRSFYDFIIISLHWGIEYSRYPTAGQIKYAHIIIDAGADAIIGHHPHIYQGIEIYKGKPVFYSTGNFIFGSINENIRDNILVELRFIKNKIIFFNVYPITGNRNTDKPFSYGLLTGMKARDVLEDLKTISIPLNSDFTGVSVINDSSLTYAFK